MRKLIVTIAAAAMMLALPGAADAATKRFVVTIKASPVNVVIETCEGKATGATLTLTGRVSPARAGREVRIYKKLVGKPWKIEGTARVRSSGRYKFTDKPTSKSVRYYKARMPTVGSYRFAYSESVRVWAGKSSCPD